MFGDPEWFYSAWYGNVIEESVGGSGGYIHEETFTFEMPR